MKVDASKSNTTIIWTPIFKWYVVICGSKSWHQKDMCLKVIGSSAQKYANHSRIDSQHDWGGGAI